MNLFQSFVLAIFALLAIAAVVIFSATSGGGGNIAFAGTFKIWGTLPNEEVYKTIDAFNKINSKFFEVQYVEKKEATFESDLVSALASGDGPDLVILPESLVVQNMDKVQLISYDSYPIRNFNDDFADISSLFMSQNGIVAMPLYIDPLVMYWNKDIFSTGGVATYPTSWNEFESLASRLTIADRASNISQGAVALGTYNNIDHAKDILAALFMQSGNDIVRFLKQGERSGTPYKVLLGSYNSDTGQPDTQSGTALRFYLDFSNPAKKAYSWNVAMPSSKAAFYGGILGVYFGPGSDYQEIQKSNPHLSFDIALLPQPSSSAKRVTFADIYGVAVTKGTKDANTAKQIAIDMSAADFAKSISTAISLPPARRDLLAAGSADPVQSVLYASAIISKSWLDPSPADSDQVFKDMTESVLSGAVNENQATRTAGQKLGNLIPAPQQ